MGKTYIDTVKYMIKGQIEIDGIVERPDVVGAIFGQTEGLLTDELDLRELLKSGRIGRIEVDIKVDQGKSTGTLEVPSSLDKTETSLIAAVLETVDRIGPCTAAIKVNSIDDTRSNKRDFVMNRAKELMKGMGDEKETKELSGELKDSMKTAKVVAYGVEKLAAGPDIDSSDELIVVEGRADVLTVLKAGVTNVIALKGAIIPKTVIELSQKKSVTLFVDGDRGGDIAVRNFIDKGKVAYVAKAPDGKEVEELTQKELLKCLKNRIPFKRFALKSSVKTPVRGQRDHSPRGRSSPRERTDSRERTSRDRSPRREHSQRSSFRDSPRAPRATPAPAELAKVYDTIKGSMKAVLLDKKGKSIAEVPVAEMINKMKSEKSVDKVVFDGIITQRLIDLAAEKKVSTLVGLKKAKIEATKGVAVHTTA